MAYQAKKKTIKVQVSVAEHIWDGIVSTWGKYGESNNEIVKEALRQFSLQLQLKERQRLLARIGVANPNN